MARGENLPAPARLRLIDIRDAEAGEGTLPICPQVHVLVTRERLVPTDDPA
jgi:hypothetical protein